MDKHYQVKFRYADDENEAKSKCISLYGLGADCDYEILSVTEI